jgi:hypothetical protein
MTSQRVQIGVSKLQPNVELRVFDGRKLYRRMKETDCIRILDRRTVDY